MTWLANFWHRHKTKMLGMCAMLVGAAQANFSQVQNLVPPHKQGLVLFGFGILTAFFGFLNSSAP